MLDVPWNVSPDELGPLDADIVRSISGQLTDRFMDRMLGPDNFAVRRRLAFLMQKHLSMPYGALAMFRPDRRRQLAEDVVRAELAERDR